MITQKEFDSIISGGSNIYVVKIIPEKVNDYVKKKSKSSYRILNEFIYSGLGMSSNDLEFHDIKNPNYILEFSEYELLNTSDYNRKKDIFDMYISMKKTLTLPFVYEKDAKECFERYLYHYINLLKGQGYQRDSYKKRHNLT